MNQSPDTEVMHLMFDRLYDYATHHFMNEEKLMKSAEYVAIDKHCEFHNDFIEKKYFEAYKVLFEIK